MIPNTKLPGGFPSRCSSSLLLFSVLALCSCRSRPGKPSRLLYICYRVGLNSSTPVGWSIKAVMMRLWQFSAKLATCRQTMTSSRSSFCMLSYIFRCCQHTDCFSNREIRAQYLFEKETLEIKFPQYQDGSFMSNFKLGFFDYLSLLRERSMSHSSPYLTFLLNDLF